MTSVEALVRWVLVLFVLHGMTRIPAQRLLGRSLGALNLPLLLLIWSYSYWLIGSVFRVDTLHIVLFFCGIFSIGSIWWASRMVEGGSKSIREKPTKHSFLIFSGLFLMAVLIRAYSPSLSHAEKFADLTFLQASLLGTHFPPVDRWLSGESVNYYYFGYMFFVPIIRLSGVPIEFAYGLSACTVYAFMGITAYAILLRASGQKWTAWMGMLSVTLFSNWEWMGQIFKLKSLRQFSWWSSSRAIEGTITEFPFFSFLLGDLHPHFVALPWMTLTFGLFYLFDSARKSGVEKKILLMMGGMTALSLGVHYPLNPWGLPFLAFLLAWMMGKEWKTTVIFGAASLFLFLPFWMTYQRPVSGIHWVPSSLHSELLPFISHWGLFLLPLTWLLFVNVKGRSKTQQIVLLAVSLAAGLVGGVVLGVLTWMAGAVLRLPTEKPYWKHLLFLSILFVGLCEVIHLDDLYGPELKRMNTVFKFYTLAWWGFSLSLPVVVTYMWKKNAIFRRGMQFMLPVLVILSLVYPVWAVYVRSERTPEIPTLNGMAYWDYSLPGEAEGVRWLRENTNPQDVIWESVGAPYGNHGRFAALSGRPSVLGWVNHQWVWRKNGRELAGARLEEIQSLLNQPKLSEVLQFLQKHSVRWIVIGTLEKREYSPELLQTLSTFPVTFSNESMEIRQVNL